MDVPRRSNERRESTNGRITRWKATRKEAALAIVNVASYMLFAAMTTKGVSHVNAESKNKTWREIKIAHLKFIDRSN
jgi:hypothetical protein